MPPPSRSCWDDECEHACEVPRAATDTDEILRLWLFTFPSRPMGSSYHLEHIINCTYSSGMISKFIFFLIPCISFLKIHFKPPLLSSVLFYKNVGRSHLLLSCSGNRRPRTAVNDGPLTQGTAWPACDGRAGDSRAHGHHAAPGLPRESPSEMDAEKPGKEKNRGWGGAGGRVTRTNICWDSWPRGSSTLGPSYTIFSLDPQMTM